MIPGVGGRLLSHAFLDREFIPALLNGPDAPRLGALIRRVDRWWRESLRELGPASASRTVLDVAVTPLLAILGHAPPAMAPEEWGHVGVSGNDPASAVLVVSTPWASPMDHAWQRAVRDGMERRARWSLVANGPSLRVMDCAHPWARRSLEFHFESLLGDPRGAVVLGALASPAALACEPADPSSLAAIVCRSDAYAARICRSLGEGVLAALVRLTAAFSPASSARSRIDGGNVFDQALTLVYRVLFLLFAEARGLVPVWHEVYREAYTIDALCRRIGEQPGAPGLWAALQAISRMAHAGCRAGDLDVTPFNGRLFSPVHAPLVEHGRVADATVQQVVLALATADSGVNRTRIAYHDLGVEQLGTVYEQVLEYEPSGPRHSPALRRTSTERKTSGSFYTPRSITEFLVRRTLHPLVEGKTSDEILALRVVDPAMGSGAFLVAACHYLADQCERALIREGAWVIGDVTPVDRSSLRRSVAERCLYGVDRNATAVQLARLSLWLTTLARDRPLTFLDHHLVFGDSLVGGRLVDLARPDAAVRTRAPAPGDPRLPLFEDEVAGVVSRRVLPERIRLALDPSDSPADVREKERRLTSLKSPTGPCFKWSRAIDVWCGLGLWPERLPPRGLAAELIAAALGSPTTLPEAQLSDWLAKAASIATEHRALHWEVEFPEVFFGSDGRPRPDGGFDAVIGNPPWDVLRADIGSDTQRASDRTRTTTLLRFFRRAGHYAHQGSGHPNSYQLFVERTMQLARPGGRFGVIVPSGFATDQGSAPLRRLLLKRTTIDTWLGFANRAGIFPIHRSVRFVLLAGTNAGSTERLTFHCGLSDAAALERRPSAAAEDAHPDAVSVSRSRLETWDPEYLTIPEIPTPEALRILSHLHSAAPRLGSRDGWGATFGRELNATDDRAHFVNVSGPSRTSRPSRALPIIQGRHLTPFRVSLESVDQGIDARVAAHLVEPGVTFERRRLAYRDVASATNRLTLMAALLPRHTVSTHTVFCLKTRLSTRDQWALLALMNSLVANYLVRARVTTHVTAALMSGLPVPRPPSDTPAYRKLVALARALARRGIDAAPDAYARLNAIAASLYRLSSEDYEAIVKTFPLLPEELRARCIERYPRRE